MTILAIFQINHWTNKSVFIGRIGQLGHQSHTATGEISSGLTMPYDMNMV